MTQTPRPWSEDQVLSLLEKVDLFAGLPQHDQRRIAAIVDGLTVAAGDVLFEEGEPGDAYYIVFSGAIEILKAKSNTLEKLAVRRDGEGFGEMALLNDAPRSASARAIEDSRLMRVPREAFQDLLGGDSIALRMMRFLSTSLRALDVRFAAAERAVGSPPKTPAPDPDALSRVMQRGMLPTRAPRAEGWDLAAGTTAEETGRGDTVWDWLELSDGVVALVVLEVKSDGFPAAQLLGQARAALRVAARSVARADQLLAEVNASLAQLHVEGVDQFVDCAVVVPRAGALHWACAGKIPAGMLGRAGTFEEFISHGPALGMLEGFKYGVKVVPMGTGDTALVLSGASPGLFRGAADLVSQVHGKPAGEVVATVHRAIRKAQGNGASEISVVYARKH